MNHFCSQPLTPNLSPKVPNFHECLPLVVFSIKFTIIEGEEEKRFEAGTSESSLVAEVWIKAGRYHLFLIFNFITDVHQQYQTQWKTTDSYFQSLYLVQVLEPGGIMFQN